MTHPKSDHFDGRRFFNPGGIPPRGFKDLVRWQFNGERARWPGTVQITPAKPVATVRDLTVTMVGHASLLIQTAGMNLLTDPVWSSHAGPFGKLGPRRVTDPGIAFEDLPKIDAVLLSHNHYDHLDRPTLRRLAQSHDPQIVTPLGNDAHLQGVVSPTRITTGDWGHTTRIGPLKIHQIPCHHWSARGVGDRRRALWSSFVIEGPAGKVLHIGDTGFDQGRPYRDLPDRHGALRLAILPIGAYAPRWFMQAQHQNPDEAVQGFTLSGAAHAIGHHWGTFQLTDEPREAPPQALAAALAAQGIAPDRFRALNPGEAWAIPKA